MSFDPLKPLIAIVGRAIRDAWKDEFLTASGRVNIIGMLLALMLCIAMVTTSAIEQLLAGIRAAIHNVDPPAAEPLYPLLITFGVWTFLCIASLYVDRLKRSQSDD